jgi:hypothetical protein
MLSDPEPKHTGVRPRENSNGGGGKGDELALSPLGTGSYPVPNLWGWDVEVLAFS